MAVRDTHCPSASRSLYGAWNSIDPQYIAASSRGATSTKAEELAGLKNADSITTCVDTNVKARIYGDAAVVTGLGTRSGTFKGVPFKDRQNLWTDTFIKRDGRWQCVATQGTLVAAQQK